MRTRKNCDKQSKRKWGTIVRVRRRDEGYEWIFNHPRRDSLIPGWCEAINSNCSLDEIQSLIIAGTEYRRDVLKAIKKSQKRDVIDVVVDWLVTAPYEHSSDCLETLSEISKSDGIQERIMATLADAPFERRATIASVSMALAADGRKDGWYFNELSNRILESHERLALSACRERSKDDCQELLEQEALQALRVLAANSESDCLAAQAIAALSRRKQSIESLLPRLLQSADVDVRSFAYGLVDATDESTNLLLNGLRDSDYRIRRAAMWKFSEAGNKLANEAIVSMANDNSAPVRAACAAIIGEKCWGDAQETLVNLLNDRRDASEGVGTVHTPNFHVARQAAASLGSLSTLDTTTVESISDFLNRRNCNHDDPVVSCSLLEALGRNPSQESINILQRYLNDDWFMPGHKNAGFPLRFAAAWGIGNIVWSGNAHLIDVCPDVLLDGAVHHDDRLAGPCICILASLGDKSSRHIARLIDSQTLSETRALLLVAALKVCGRESQPALRTKLGQNHAIHRILELADDARPENDEDWLAFLTENVDVSNWIESIQSTDDMNSCIRFSLACLFGKKAKTKLRSDDLRSRDLAEQIKVMTMRSMFGGE